MQLRRTKIVATLGPATDDPKVLDRIINAGVDVVRLNFSHDTAEKHMERAKTVRNRVRAHGRQVGVLVDLQGPKIRIRGFKNSSITLQEGDSFALDATLGKTAGNKTEVGIAYQQLPNDVKRGDTLLLDDGRIVLRVLETTDTRIECKVAIGGKLSNNKGINLQGGGLSAKALTEQDRKDIRTAAEIEADYVAISFPRNAADVHEARSLLREAGGHGGIVAKIERSEALENIDEIIEASDVIMIARGDLGVEIGDASLPPVQKKLIHDARERNRVVITATQMMESMIENQIPTRAEVFDVANAVLDGTDAVMLSAETAMGEYPDKAIEAMDRICKEAEKQRQARESAHRIGLKFSSTDEAIAMATMYTANHTGSIAAIASLTESGSTPLWMSRISSGIPIFALTRHVETRRKVTLYRGVYPVSFELTSDDIQESNCEIVDELLRRGTVRNGDEIIITKGDRRGISGGTNLMKILKVGNHYGSDSDNG